MGFSSLGGNNLIYNESEDAYYIQHGADSVPKKLGGYNGELYFESVTSYIYATYASYFDKLMIVNLHDYNTLTIDSITLNHSSQRYACVLGDDNVELLKVNDITTNNVEIDISNHSTITLCLYVASGVGNSQAVFTGVTIK